MNRSTLFSAVFCVLAGGFLAATEAQAQTGRDIAVKSQKVSFGYKSLTARAKMTLYRGDKVVGTRDLTVSQVEQPEGTFDQALVHIDAPASLARTRLLSWSDNNGEDQQWITTGNTNRARRIGGRGRKATFVNSDFTFEDLLKWQVDAYTYEIVGKTDCPAGNCTQVRARPTSRASAYAELLIDYDSKYRISRIQYFRKANGPVWKELVATGYTRVGNTAQPGRSVMTNFTTKTRTHIEWSNYASNPALDPSIFSPQ
jgi:hypothetical protein